ncbi:MAG: hypothetical protein F9B45_31485 [Phycisphaera sp. RhM]|nr:hypothetical protein [Phycisphaera sp. RhM]
MIDVELLAEELGRIRYITADARDDQTLVVWIRCCPFEMPASLTFDAYGATEEDLGRRMLQIDRVIERQGETLDQSRRELTRVYERVAGMAYGSA